MPTKISRVCSPDTWYGSAQPSGTSALAGPATPTTAAEAARTTAVRRTMVARMLVTAVRISARRRRPRPDPRRLGHTGVCASEIAPGRGHTGAHVWARHVRTMLGGRADLPGPPWTSRATRPWPTPPTYSSASRSPSSACSLLGLVIRWVLHRLVDRVVAQRRGRRAPGEPLHPARPGHATGVGPGRRHRHPAGPARQDDGRPAQEHRHRRPGRDLRHDDAQRARRQHRADHRQRRQSSAWRWASAPSRWSRTSCPASS